MRKAYIVIQGYQSSNADPIELEAGDAVRPGEEFKDEASWPNWIRCVSVRTGKSGWTPKQILRMDMDGETSAVTEAYTAREMTVAAGELVSGYKELNGWLWCVRESDGQSGWLPKSCLKPAGQ